MVKSKNKLLDVASKSAKERQQLYLMSNTENKPCNNVQKGYKEWSKGLRATTFVVAELKGKWLYGEEKF